MPQKRDIGLNPNSFVSRKRTVKLTRKSVLKMLAVMEASQAGPSKDPPPEPPETTGPMDTPEDFFHTGRTGRRNALPNILNEHAVVSSSDLPTRLESLTTKDKDEEEKKAKKEPEKEAQDNNKS